MNDGISKKKKSIINAFHAFKNLEKITNMMKKLINM